MHSPARTDEALSRASAEFEWDEAGANSTQSYLAGKVMELLRRDRAQRVLDLGCGNGWFTGQLAAQGLQVAGCDASESGIRIARASFPGIGFFQHDLANALPEEYRARFDAVVSLEVIEHLLLPRTLLSNARDALRPGGVLVLSTPYHGYLKNLALAVAGRFDEHWHPLRDFGHVKFFSKKTLLQLIDESGLETEAWMTAGRIPWLACSMMVAARKN